MRIICMGDSIMQYNDCNTYPQTGWIQLLTRFFPLGTEFLNFARNGRSTKSFITDGRFKTVCDTAKEGDYVLIQFGHNDEKIADPNRYCAPDEGGEYRANLMMFITELRKLGTFPVLLSPMARRKFDEAGRPVDSHGTYPAAMKAVAAEMNVPFVDMSALTLAKLGEAGKDATRAWYMNFDAGVYDNYPQGKVDDSHLRSDGAYVFSKIAAAELAQIGGQSADYKALSGAVLTKPVDRAALEKEVSDEYKK